MSHSSSGRTPGFQPGNSSSTLLWDTIQFRGHSSIERAPVLQAGGWQFKSAWLHQYPIRLTVKPLVYIQEIAVQLCYGTPITSTHRCGRGEMINALGCDPSHYGFESHRSPLWVLENGSVAQMVEHLVEAQAARGRNLPDPPRLRSSSGRALACQVRGSQFDTGRRRQYCECG